MSAAVAWSRLVRYRPVGGSDVRLGQPIVDDEQSSQVAQLASEGKLEVEVLSGNCALDAVPTGERERVGTLLGPLTAREVPIIRCIGLNYKSHSAFLFWT